jgi:hypothetical protein
VKKTKTITTTTIPRHLQQIKDAIEATWTNIGNLQVPKQEASRQSKQIGEVIEKMRAEKGYQLTEMALKAAIIVERPTKQNNAERCSIKQK